MRSRDDGPATPERRGAALALGSALLAPLALAACTPPPSAGQPGAAEQLMLQHGLQRRLLSLYRRCALTLRINSATLDAGALAEAVGLFRSYGQDFHERALEEALVFPRLERAGGPLAALVAVMRQQHQRGRELVDFILAQAAGGTIGPAQAEPAARALEALADMYQAHASFEDTELYPAWRGTFSEPEWREMGARVAGLERGRYKADAFETVRSHVAALERRLGAAGAATYTAPAPSLTPGETAPDAQD